MNHCAFCDNEKICSESSYKQWCGNYVNQNGTMTKKQNTSLVALEDTVSQNIDCDTGMTYAEQQCLDSVIDAWNKFVSLERQHQNELRDFTDSVHRIQGILTTRMARRLYPKDWPTYNE